MYYNLPVDKVVETFNTSLSDGLSFNEVRKRLEKYGPNSLSETYKPSAVKRFLKQFTDVLVLVLIGAAGVSFILGERLDATVIFAIVVINALMGYVQEAKAEEAIDALKKLSTDSAKVIRERNLSQIDTKDLVPGDIIILETGDKIPADARLIEAINLEISESILTGESHPIKKSTELLSKVETPLNDQINMVFKDTTVLYGRGKALVVETGETTEIGKISQMLQKEKKDETPLGTELNIVGKKLSLLAGIIIAVIVVIGLVTKQFDVRTSFLTSVSLAVAAIPEGLPAIVTIVLAIGVSRLAKSKAIIRRLEAVETLGSTNYILTDKTGTLTMNEMVVSDIALPNQKYKISFNNTITDISDHIIDPMSNDLLLWLLKIASLCNDAQECVKDEPCVYMGDSTEVALLEMSHKAGLNISELRDRYERIFEIPFSSEDKKMVVVVKDPENEAFVYVIAKGASEVIQWMVKENNEIVTGISNEYTHQGLRTLAFSAKHIPLSKLEEAKTSENPQEILSTYHTFLGIVAQKDPLRPDVKNALNKAKLAGIETIILTGDHKLTASNIAKELGLISSDDEVADGNELGNISDEELKKVLEKVKVFARVSPQQKLQITKVIKNMNMVVAVTGDGVNDAPAIKAADIGVSMGISGTDVSKEVADVVLQDDNYATIVEAIKQGRIVYDNLVKFIRYLISCNISEIFVVGIAIFSGFPLPLLPIHILWINLVTDGLPALSLGVEPGEKDIMLRPPRSKNEGLLTKARWIRMTLEALILSGATITMFLIGLRTSLAVAQTLALLTLSSSQLIHALNNRSELHSIFSKKLLPNKYLVFTLLFSFLILLLVVYTNIGNTLLKTVPVSPELLVISLTASIVPLAAIEFEKFFLRYNK